eukprot:103166_1
MGILFTIICILQSTANTAPNTTGTHFTTTSLQTTQFQTTSPADLLSNLQIKIDEFKDVIQDSMCKNGLAVGGPKCDEDFYGIQEFIDSFDEYMNVGSIDASKEVFEIVQTLNDKLSLRTNMLYNLSKAIKTSCLLYVEELDAIELPEYDDLYFAGTNKVEARLPDDMYYSDIYNRQVSFSASTFSIPHNVNYKNSDFKFDAIITSLLDPIFINLHNDYCAANHVLARSEQFCQMYFGSVNGMFRIFPASEDSKDSEGVYQSYDARLRPWYISASAGDTDVIILLDVSISMKDKMDLVNDAIQSVFGTLSSTSFVTIIGFNHKVQETCLTDRLFAATQDNFEYLSDWLLDIEFVVAAMDFAIGIDAAYELINKHRFIYGRNCNTAILFITDSGEKQIEKDILELIDLKRSNSDLGVDDVVIFTYTIGNGADLNLAKSIANSTGGIHTHIKESEEFIGYKMSIFYKYFSFEKEANDVIIASRPYFDFSTGTIMFTLSMPLFYNDTFVGVFGMDIPLGVFEDVIGDVPIGIKSYSFLMNSKGLLFFHPSTPNSVDYNSGLFSEFQAISANDVEPNEFVKSGVFQSMLGGEKGFKQVSISYKQSLGNPVYNGFIDIDTDVIYFYSPIAPLLSFGVVVWNDDKFESPLISDFGLETVKPKICPDLENIQNVSEIKPNEMNSCLARFNLFHELELFIKCSHDPNNSNTQDWTTQANILGIDTSKISNINTYKNLFNQYEFYNNKNISLDYATYFLQSGLWESGSDALKGTNPTCEQLNNLQKMAIPSMLSPRSNSIPYGGFKEEFNSHTLVSIYVFSSLYNWWKPSFLRHNSQITSLWFGSYQGIHFSYPGKKFSSTYNSLKRPWFKEAIAWPHYFVLPPPDIHATTGNLVAGASTVIYAPNRTDQIIGVAGMNWEYSGFVTAWRDVMDDVCHGEFSFNQCYLITTSGYFLYYEGMEYDVSDEDISHKFLGDYEPTLMQSLLKLGLFKKRQYENVIDSTISISYLLDENIFINLEFSSEFRTFEKNSGLYTVHH